MIQFKTLRYALITNQNRDLFGGVHPIPPKSIERVIALKRENPGLTATEISDALKEEGLSMSDNWSKLNDEGEIELIFSVYFSEFQ